MAAKNLLKRLEELNKNLGGNFARDSIAKSTARCTVNANEMAKSLIMAWKRFNPIAAGAGGEQGRNEQAQKTKDFKAFGKDVVRDFKVKIARSDVLIKSSKDKQVGDTKVVFWIRGKKDKGTVSNVNDEFAKINKKITQDLMLSPKYLHLFSLKNQEKLRDDGAEKYQKKFTAKGLGDLSLFNAAHGAGFSIAEGKEQAVSDFYKDFENPSANIGVDKRTGTPLAMENLPASVIDLVASGKPIFTDLVTKADRNYQYNVASGKIEAVDTVDLSIQTQFENQSDSKASMSTGRSQLTAMKALKEALDAEIKKNSKDWDATAEGSGSVLKGVGDAIVNTPYKKRLYKKKLALNATQFKGKSKSSTSSANAESQIETKVQEIRGGGPAAGMRAAAAKRKRRGKEKGSGGVGEQQNFALQMRNLLKVKRAINQRLPAEVRRNMGKPALQNQSGRFANSARVTSILPAAQTLMVKYSYRLNPYETYENTGKKKWPTGYNPKPLIAKSIRGLALGLVTEKLTLRRD